MQFAPLDPLGERRYRANGGSRHERAAYLPDRRDMIAERQIEAWSDLRPAPELAAVDSRQTREDTAGNHAEVRSQRPWCRRKTERTLDDLDRHQGCGPSLRRLSALSPFPAPAA